MSETQPAGASEPGLKKPSLISQVLPYLLAAGFLAWVFTGLSTNVINEPHELIGTEWAELEGQGVKTKSITLADPDGSKWCAAGADDSACPAGGDFEVRPEDEGQNAAVRRTSESRIRDGSTVLVSYVKKVKPADVWAILSRARLGVFLPFMALHVLIFFFGDVFSFGLPYRWFNAPGMRWREVMECRGAPYLAQVVLAPLAEVLFPLYLKRVKKVPVPESLSTNLMTIIIDFSALFTVLTPAVIYNLYVNTLVPEIGGGWLVACIVFWVVYLSGILFWHSPLQHRARAFLEARREKNSGGLQIMRSFSLARWHQILRIWLVRLSMQAGSLMSNYAALVAVGVHPDPALALIGIPIVVFSVFMPVGVGGYGGPQLIAWFLFVKLGDAGTADQVVAYSLLWSTSFLVGRALIGLIFIRGFWKRCFPEGFKI